MEDEFTEQNMDAVSFSNEQVWPTDIPKLATIEHSNLEPAYRTVSLISTSIFFALVAIGIFVIRMFDNEFFVEYGFKLLLGIGVLYLLFLLLVILEFKKKSYALRERDIVFNEGLIWQSSTVIPFNRVQHCEISQGPIERMFGLSELKIFTAGGSSSDMRIQGLSPDTADRLKEYIVSKTGVDEEE